MALDVRRIRPSEGSELKRIRLAALLDAPSAFGSTHAAEAAQDDRFWDRRAERGAAGIDSVMVLAMDGDRAVAIGGAYRPDDSPSLVEVVSVWTAPTIRGSGVGRRVVSAVVDWATSVQPEAVMLWVTSGNTPALRLYESIGFRVTGDEQALPSDPTLSEIRMRLDPAD